MRLFSLPNEAIAKDCSGRRVSRMAKCGCWATFFKQQQKLLGNHCKTILQRRNYQA